MGSEGAGPRSERVRVFFALWPDERVRAGLQRAAADGARRFGGRAMRGETLHLTLAFVGDVPVAGLLRLRAAAEGVRCQAFGLDLDRLGFWSHNRILWAGSGGDFSGLSQLAQDLAGCLEAAGFPTGIRPGRPFAPHVTLVRNVADRHPELPTVPSMHWSCRDFVLVRSRLSSAGAAYEIIGRWALAGLDRATPLDRDCPERKNKRELE